MLQSIIFYTLGQLATGILLFIAMVPPSRIGAGFGRFHTLLSLGLWILAFRGHFSIQLFVLSSILILAAVFAVRDVLYYPFLVIGFVASVYLLVHPFKDQGIAYALLLQIPPALVLGGSAVSMLLGHWYLVAPKLPIGYLKAATVSLIAVLLIRSSLIAGTLWSGAAHLSEIRFFETYGIFLLQRITLGLLLTLVLSVLTYYCVKIRSTQSATGILYVVVVFCLVGEVIGWFLFQKTGLFL